MSARSYALHSVCSEISFILFCLSGLWVDIRSGWMSVHQPWSRAEPDVTGTNVSGRRLRSYSIMNIRSSSCQAGTPQNARHDVPAVPGGIPSQGKFDHIQERIRALDIGFFYFGIICSSVEHVYLNSVLVFPTF